ncbi:MAG: YbaB/EbfC family nucleoid-associated protein [Alphaproteobacteria bacterium]
MKNFGNLLKQAQQMQAKMADAQAQLDVLEIEGASGGGKIQVMLNGHGALKGIKIDPSLITPDDPEMLEDLIIAAFNDAKKKVDDTSSSLMGKVTGGMGLPGGLKLPF